MGNETNKEKPKTNHTKNTFKSIGPFGILPCSNIGFVLLPDKKSFRLDMTNSHLFGVTSPCSPITLGDDAKEMAKIPVHAKSFLYCYPIKGYIKNLNNVVSANEKFIYNGGFVYLDEDEKVVMVNAIDNEAGNDLIFDDVQPFNDLQKIDLLNKGGRFQPVTFESLISKGIQKYCWILPGETTTSGSVLCSHGAFLYVSDSGCCYFPVRDAINYGKYTAVWEWLSKNVWLVYDLQSNLVLEEAYKNKKETVTLNHGKFNGDYVVNFKGDKFTQTNVKTNFVRSIRRLKGEVTTNLATWECLVQKKWTPYDKKINEILESRFFAACLSLMPSKLTLDYGFAEKSPYSIDFVEMKQVNIETGFARYIRRQVDASVEPPDDPNVIEPSERWGLRDLHVIDNNFVPPDMRKPCYGQIAVQVKSAHNIAGIQPYPFVVVTTTFSSFFWSSTWKYKTIAPVWNETCVIPVNSENQMGEVIFTLFDKQWTKNCYLGKVIVPLKEIAYAKEISGNMKFDYECRNKVGKEENPSMMNLNIVFNETQHGNNKSQITFSYLANLKAKLVKLANTYPLLYNQPLDPHWQNLLKCTIHEIENPDFIEGMSGAKYNFGSLLGKGSYTIIKKAVNMTSGNTVAIKIIEKLVDVSREEHHIITNEIAFLYIISHLREGVVDYFTQLLDIQETSDSLYIVMPYCHFDLFTIVEESLKIGNGEPVIDEPRIKRITIDILQGLFFLHMLGICHRDIKPENILYDPLSQIWKIADFGVSVFIHDKEGLKGNIGTIPYMAPEMFRDQEYTIAVDMWATGVTIFVVLSAQFPWNCETEDIQESILNCEISFSHRWDKVIGKEFVLKLMEPEPSWRLTALDALRHSWLEKESKDVVQRLEQFIK